IAPDRSVAITAGIDKTMRVWSLRPSAEVRSFDAGAPISALAVSADGNLLACGDLRGNVQLRDVTTLGLLLRIDAHHRPIDSATFLSDGRLFTSDGGRACKIWEVASGRELRS